MSRAQAGWRRLRPALFGPVLLGPLLVGSMLAGGRARAALITSTPGAALSSVPVTISFGGTAARYSFTAAATGNGPGAAVATAGTAMVASFFGALTDFGAGSTIDRAPTNLYGFSAFPNPTTIPNSPADDFIGLSFTLLDGVHYGYAEVAGPTLVSYAYDSTPGAGVTTAPASAAVPEPATTALLGAGIAFVLAARRRRTAA